MTKKTLTIALLSLAVFVAVPLSAMAWPHAYPAAPQLSQEQVAQMDKLYDEHRAAAAPLYEQLAQKRMELRALAPNPNVKPEELKALTAEISALHEKIRVLNQSFYDSLDKAGLPCYGYGYGRHGGFHDRGYDGYGHRHGGHGCAYWR